VVPVGRQRVAQRRHQLGLHLRTARQGGGGQGRGPVILRGALIHDGLELPDRAGQARTRTHLGDRVVQRRPGGGARGQQRAQGGRLLGRRDRPRRRRGRRRRRRRRRRRQGRDGRRGGGRGRVGGSRPAR